MVRGATLATGRELRNWARGDIWRRLWPSNHESRRVRKLGAIPGSWLGGPDANEMILSAPRASHLMSSLPARFLETRRRGPGQANYGFPLAAPRGGGRAQLAQYAQAVLKPAAIAGGVSSVVCLSPAARRCPLGAEVRASPKLVQLRFSPGRRAMLERERGWSSRSLAVGRWNWARPICARLAKVA